MGRGNFLSVFRVYFVFTLQTEVKTFQMFYVPEQYSGRMPNHRYLWYNLYKKIETFQDELSSVYRNTYWAS